MINRKPIPREQIINMALELLRNHRDVQNLNLYKIVRTLGYAHADLYNYFLSYPRLLQEAHTVRMQRMPARIGTVVAAALAPKYKLQAFYYAMVCMYLDNTGWFRLAWLEYLREQRPKNNTLTVTAAREQMNCVVVQIWRELPGRPADVGKLEEVVYLVRCHLIGEVSNYISDRRVIEDEEESCQSVVHQTIRSTVLLLREE